MKPRGARDVLATFESSTQVFETQHEHGDLLCHPGTQALDIRSLHVKF